MKKEQQQSIFKQSTVLIFFIYEALRASSTVTTNYRVSMTANNNNKTDNTGKTNENSKRNIKKEKVIGLRRFTPKTKH